MDQPCAPETAWYASEWAFKIFALVAFLFFEFVLGKTSKTQAGSTLELLINLILRRKL